MEVALNVNQGIKDRLSRQYLDSNFYYAGKRAGCGGTIDYFANFYKGNSSYWSSASSIAHIAVPWSNTNASYKDGNYSVCNSYSGTTVTTSPNYPLLTVITVETVETVDVTQSEAIANIKAVLMNNQALYFAMYQPNSFSEFKSFWANDAETDVWTPSVSTSANSGHAVLCVGWDDSDHSWIMLNSWGTTSGRSNGLFRITQYLDYSATYKSGYYTYKFSTLDNLFSVVTTAPTVTTDEADVDMDNATLNGSLTGMGDNEQAAVYFNYGAGTSYGITTAEQTLSGVGSFSTDLTGLTDGQTYHFQAVARGLDTGETTYGADATFTTGLIAPEVTTEAASSIGTTTAKLNGYLDSLGSCDSPDVYFQWGPTTYYGNTTAVQSKSATGSFSATLNGLSSDTLYYFQAVAEGDGTVYGDRLTFTTAIPSVGDPVIVTQPAKAIKDNSANLNAKLTNLGTVSPVMVNFEYGTTTDYGLNTAYYSKSTTGTILITVSGLSPGTLYHFRAQAEGLIQTCGDDLTFTTTGTAIVPPAVTTAGASGVGAENATLNGNLTTPGSLIPVEVSFEYGTTSSYGTGTSPQSMTDAGSFCASISGLMSNTVYHYRSRAEGSAVVYGADMTFTTGYISPVISTGAATEILASSASLNGSLTTLGSLSPVSVYFEYGTTLDYENMTDLQSLSETGDFNAAVSGLLANTVYHFRTVAAGMLTIYGEDATFSTITADVPAVALNQTSPVTGITSSTAVINAELLSLGTASQVTASVEYGISTDYGAATTGVILGSAGAFTINLTQLDSDSTYHYRVKAAGNGTVYTDDGTFITSVLPFSVTTNKATVVTTSSATLQGSLAGLGTETLATLYFEYGTTAVYGTTVEASPSTRDAAGDFSLVLSGLAKGTYHYRAVAVGAATVYGDDRTFTTRSSSGGGGGGGGGGSSSKTATARTVTVTLNGANTKMSLDSSGKLLKEFVMKSADGRTTLIIPAGTIIKMPDGTIPSSITITSAQGAWTDNETGMEAAGEVLDLEPSGLVFNPAVSLILTYNPDKLHTGFDEKDLKAGYYDESQDRWIVVDSTVNTDLHTVTASVAHLTDYAVLQPAAVILASASVAATPAVPSVVTPAASATPPASVTSTSAVSTPTPIAVATQPADVSSSPAVSSATAASSTGNITWLISAIIVIVLAAVIATVLTVNKKGKKHLK